MAEFLRDLAWLRKQLSRINPWNAAILVLAVGVFGYYVVLGARYWSTSQRIEALTAQTQQLAAVVRRSAIQPTTSGVFVSPEKRLEELRGLFTYPSTDDMIAIVSSSAYDTGVALVSVSVGEPQAKTVANVTYQTLPLGIRLQGHTNDIYRFLGRIQEVASSVTVTDVRLTGLEGTPIAQVQALFYQSPSPAATPTKEKKATK